MSLGRMKPKYCDDVLFWSFFGAKCALGAGFVGLLSAQCSKILLNDANGQVNIVTVQFLIYLARLINPNPESLHPASQRHPLFSFSMPL
jgi:hypothetical protein